MPVRYEEPTISKPEDRGYNRGETTITHPAYGLIGLTRCTCSPSQEMFGTSVKHGSYIKLTIKTAVKTTNGDYGFIHGDKTLCEVELSGNQLGDLLSSMNVGDGVPCTIRRTETNWDIPMIKNQESPVEESRKSFEKRLKELNNVAKDTAHEANELLKQKTVSKKDLAAIVGKLYKIEQELSSNQAFVNECFERKIEKTITEAKAEVDCFVNTVIANTGIAALKNGIVALPFKDVKEIEL